MFAGINLLISLVVASRNHNLLEPATDIRYNAPNGVNPMLTQIFVYVLAFDLKF